MTQQATRPRPTWRSEPSTTVTGPDAVHGTIRHDSDGTQWYLDGETWRPVVIKPEPEREAGS